MATVSWYNEHTRGGGGGSTSQEINLELQIIHPIKIRSLSSLSDDLHARETFEFLPGKLDADDVALQSSGV